MKLVVIVVFIHNSTVYEGRKSHSHSPVAYISLDCVSYTIP